MNKVRVSRSLAVFMCLLMVGLVLMQQALAVKGDKTTQDNGDIKAIKDSLADLQTKIGALQTASDSLTGQLAGQLNVNVVNTPNMNVANSPTVNAGEKEANILKVKAQQTGDWSVTLKDTPQVKVTNFPAASSSILTPGKRYIFESAAMRLMGQRLSGTIIETYGDWIRVRLDSNDSQRVAGAEHIFLNLSQVSFFYRID